jgi:uncharacterized protein with HEPN domain
VTRDPRLYVQDIAQSVEDIESYTVGLTEAEFYASRLIQDAVVRRLEIIGEASRQMPAEIRLRYPNVPWRRLAGLRNRITHEYFGIQLERIWQFIKRDLPVLKETIHRVQRDQEPE